MTLNRRKEGYPVFSSLFTFTWKITDFNFIAIALITFFTNCKYRKSSDMTHCDCTNIMCVTSARKIRKITLFLLLFFFTSYLFSWLSYIRRRYIETNLSIWIMKMKQEQVVWFAFAWEGNARRNAISAIWIELLVKVVILINGFTAPLYLLCYSSSIYIFFYTISRGVSFSLADWVESVIL